MPQPPLTPIQQEKYWEDHRPALLGSLITFLIINNTCVISKWWVQWRSLGRFFAEDVAILIAGVLINAVCSCLIVSTHFGLGLHTWRINSEDPQVAAHLSKVLMFVWVIMVLVGPTFTAIKVSLLCLYKRLFLVHQKWLRVAWCVNLIYVILWFIGATSYYLFHCSKPEWYFLHYYKDYHEPVPGSIKNGQCNVVSVTHTSLPIILSLISDVGLLCLPMATISTLQMKKKKKIAMTLLFAIGALACTLELVRIIALRVDTDDKKDPLWGDVNFLILSAAVEVTALMCACLLVIGPYCVKELRHFQDKRAGGPRYTYTPGRSWPRAIRKIITSDMQLEDTTGLRDMESGKTGKSGETIEMKPVDKVDGSEELVNKKPNKSNIVVRQTEVDVTAEQDQRRTIDPIALPPLDDHDAPEKRMWKIV